MIKQGLIIVITAVTVTLAAVVAYRLSVDALALIVGVFLGILVLIPTLVLSFFLLRKQSREERAEASRAQAFGQPPVVIVSGGYPAAMMSPPPNQNPQPALTVPKPQRQFRVLGFEGTEMDEQEDAVWKGVDLGVM